MQHFGSCAAALVVGSALVVGTIGPAGAMEGDPLTAFEQDVGTAGQAPQVPESGQANARRRSTTESVPSGTDAKTATGTDTADAPKYVTMDEVKTEVKKLAWTKGDFTITPYGILWGSMAYQTQRTFPGNYTLYVLSPSTDRGSAFYVDARSTRLGIDVLGPRIPCMDCAQSGGRVEIDFQRLIDTENRPSVLLRHAYVEVKNEDFRFLAGQTWDVISPLYPGTLMYSVGWDAGNIGYRRAQFRYERYVAYSEQTLLTLQGSLNTSIVNEVTPGLVTSPGGWPLVEGRIATTLGPRGPGCHPIDIGVSGHIGEELFDFLAPTWNPPVTGLYRRTWSFNVDVRVPITASFGVQGEFFTGENLGSFFGGVGQGIDVGEPAAGATRRAIRSTGGWVEVWRDWTCRLHNHVGFGIDDPADQDVTVGGRTYNQFIFANVAYDITRNFLVGLEVSQWKTLWDAPLAPGDSTRLECVVKYSF